MTRSCRALAAACSLLAGACLSDQQAPGDTARYHGAEVQAIPENVLAAAVEVRATGYDSALVEYATGAGPSSRTPAISFGSLAEWT